MIEREIAAEYQLGEGAVVLLAAATWCGATIAAPIPLAPTAAVVVVALLARRPVLFIVAAGLVASGLGYRAVSEFVPVEPSRELALEVTVVNDPRPVGVGWQAAVRLPDDRRVRATGFGSPGFRLGQASVGDRLVVDGRLRPMPDSPWARSRHLLGRLELETVVSRAPPAGPRALVERLRAVVVAGADRLPEADRSLYLGLVVGEDRFQAPDQRARFAAAGLAHLLAVSGQNVAFVLVVLRPVAQLVKIRGRFTLTLAVLVFFALVTRLEPSVLRATVTAGLAAAATLSGQRQSGIRLLGLAVTALVLVDPFLVYSVGFQLSVTASAGILLITPAVASRLPGPTLLTAPLAVTLGAQVAVLPLLSARFGPVSAVSIPANLAAGWAAGFVMTWGLTAGIVAGAIDGTIGRWLQAPALLALRWLDGVASAAVGVPAPMLDTAALAISALLFLAWWVARPRSVRVEPGVATDNRALGRAWAIPRKLVGTALLGALIAVAASRIPETPSRPTELSGGGFWIPEAQGTPSVLVVDAAANLDLLDSLLEYRIDEVDVLIVESGSGGGKVLARAVMELVSSELVLAPPQHRLVGARRVTEPIDLPAGGVELSIVPEANRLRVGW